MARQNDAVALLTRHPEAAPCDSTTLCGDLGNTGCVQTSGGLTAELVEVCCNEVMAKVVVLVAETWSDIKNLAEDVAGLSSTDLKETADQMTTAVADSTVALLREALEGSGART